jgi:GNAT superfamily N-acetyltransferase
MREEDVPAVVAISDVVHGRFTERPEVFAERLALYPAGCFVQEREGATGGYMISHPWHRRSPVPLDVLIGAIPEDAESYFLHDLALLPDVRGSGAGRRGLELVLRHASDLGYGEVSLVAVNGADSFWSAQGFLRIEDEAVVRKLQSYGEGTFFMERGV